MLSYCLKCTKKTENKKPIVEMTKKGGITRSSNCTVCGSKKSKFIEEQEAKGLSSSLGITIPLSQISIVGPILF